MFKIMIWCLLLIGCSSNNDYPWKTLEMLVNLENEFQINGYLDSNSNGIGEYCSFAQLYKNQYFRTKLNEFELVSTNNGNILQKKDYYFKLYLPTKDNKMSSDSSPKEFNEKQEIFFLIYAWPVKNEIAGSPIYCINSVGEIGVFYDQDKRYSGRKKQPEYYISTTQYPEKFKCGYPNGPCADGWLLFSSE